jgi:hypothetical protein
VTSASHFLISSSAEMLLAIGNGVFPIDGVYSLTADGLSYAVELTSYVDSMSTTLNWRIVSVQLQNDTFPRSMEDTTVDTARYIYNNLQQTILSLQYIPKVLNFHSSASINCPLEKTLLSLRSEPDISGLSQQSTWLTTINFWDHADIVVSVIIFYYKYSLHNNDCICRTLLPLCM